MTVAYKTFYMCMMYMCICLHIFVYMIYIQTYIHIHTHVSLLATLINVIALPTTHHLSVGSQVVLIYSGSGAFSVFWTFHLKYGILWANWQGWSPSPSGTETPVLTAAPSQNAFLLSWNQI